MNADFIKENWNRVQEIIYETAIKTGRNPNKIEVVAVSKGCPTSYIEEAVKLGIKKIGENRVQEAEKKINLLQDLQCEWHMVGHLQKNKIRNAINLFSLIHSLDSLDLAYAINKIAEKEGKEVDLLIQFNLSREPTKHGFLEEDFWSVYEKIFELKNIKVQGVMTIGPLISDKEVVRSVFRRLYEIWRKLNKDLKLNLPYISMGMSEDFRIAIEEGANLLRLGRVIFLKDFEVRI